MDCPCCVYIILYGGLWTALGTDRRNDMARPIIPAVQALALGQSRNIKCALRLDYYCLNRTVAAHTVCIDYKLIK